MANLFQLTSLSHDNCCNLVFVGKECNVINSCVWIGKHYVCCVYCSSGSHANILIWNELEVEVLQKDR